MVVAEGIPQIFLPADPGFHDSQERDARLGRLRRGAIIAAALGHAAVIAILLIRLPWLVPAPDLPKPIAVTLVTEAPPPPPPPPPPPAKTQAQPPPRFLESGPDQKTTAPPAAETKAPEAAPKPAPKPATETAKAAPEAAPKPPEPRAKPKLAKREAAPEPRRRMVNIEPGDQRLRGDPYLNRLNVLIEAHRQYPANAIGSLGLHLEGTTVCLIAIMSDGRLEGVKLERSSGSALLDQAAINMIEESAPFPPLPDYFPHPGVIIEATIHLFPGAAAAKN